MKQNYTFILKDEYKATPALQKEVREILDVFYIDEHKFLGGLGLPPSIKKQIDNLWQSLPISKISHQFKVYALVEYELENLKRDPICGRNSNKIWWIKAYLMDWFCNLPEVCTTEIVFAQLMTGKARRLMILEAYEKISMDNIHALSTRIFGFSLDELKQTIDFATLKNFKPKVDRYV